jgi:hypothetical protein
MPHIEHPENWLRNSLLSKGRRGSAREPDRHRSRKSFSRSRNPKRPAPFRSPRIPQRKPMSGAPSKTELWRDLSMRLVHIKRLLSWYAWNRAIKKKEAEFRERAQSDQLRPPPSTPSASTSRRSSPRRRFGRPSPRPGPALRESNFTRPLKPSPAAQASAGPSRDRPPLRRAGGSLRAF